MSKNTSINILNILDQHSKNFLKKFYFYLDATDKIFALQSKMGLDKPAMQKLSEDDKNLVKTYLFLMESGNTTWAATLRLLSSNFLADSYSLIRILYEIGSLFHYGNSSPPDTRLELYQTMFKSGLNEEAHRKQEWILIQKAEQLIESENPELVNIRRELNNFGGHISRSKVVLGNVTTFGNALGSRVFTPNWTDRRYLAGLDFLFLITTLILEEYANFQETYNGISPEVKAMVKELTNKFLTYVRPKLQDMIQK